MEEFVQMYETRNISRSYSRPPHRKERMVNTPPVDAMDEIIEQLVSPRPCSPDRLESITLPRHFAVAFDLDGLSSSASVSPPAKQQSTEPQYAQAA